MKTSPANALRQQFLDFFARHGHAVVKSSSLVPAGDPTLMFTNAGMVQFKDVFVGAETRPYTRAATAQKCMRVSGKHNDLEEVGRTARHHTLFEMLGNFSFGDYFKEGAIEMAWEFLGRDLDMPKDRIWVTVFGGAEGIPADDEARALWRRIAGLPDHRILNRGMKDNFWAMGDTGPCGPCTEIHFDLRPASERETLPRDADFDAGRVVEFWNNVFMQFERKPGGTLVPLPAPSVDTGMGLERLAAIVQGVDSNYHTDLFRALIDGIATRARKTYRQSDSEDDVSIRVIADHARAAAFLTADGVQPSNEGRGYVMRRIMRRAIRHGKRLGCEDLFFDRACLDVVDHMGEAYSELRDARALIEKVAQTEERSFRRTLDTGLSLLSREIERARAGGAKAIEGAAVFKLYDTYGFPKDLTEVIAGEQGLAVDEPGFAREMELQRERSRGSLVGEAAVGDAYKRLKQDIGAVTFIGYEHEDADLGARPGTWRRHTVGGTPYLQAKVTVRALLQNGQPVSRASDGDVEIVLEPTPFYGESGGQVGDRGLVSGDGLTLEILDSKKPVDELTVSRGRLLAGALKVGDTVWAGYDPEVRRQTRAHHSATHLLHGALRKVLGTHVKQAGSLVDPDHLRFDFSHFEAPGAEVLRAVEDDANLRVSKRHPVITDVLPFEQAKAKGAIAMFGEKYGDVVRVLTMGESVEFCGGTHVANTGDIGFVLVTREEAVSSGVRRIEAEVGEAAARRTARTHHKLTQALALLRGEDLAAEDSILQAVAKAARTARELDVALQKAGKAVGPAVKAAQVPALPEVIDLAAARRVRDTWNGLVQLSNTKASEAVATAQAIFTRFPGASQGGLLEAFAELLANNRDRERAVNEAKSSALGARTGELLERAETIGGVRLLAARVDGVDGKALRGLSDQIRDQLRSGVIALATVQDGKVTLLIGVTSDLTARFKAGDLIKTLAPLVGGRGGGKPDLAQAGGDTPEGIDRVFEGLRTTLAKH